MFEAITYPPSLPQSWSYAPSPLKKEEKNLRSKLKVYFGTMETFCRFGWDHNCERNNCLRKRTSNGETSCVIIHERKCTSQGINSTPSDRLLRELWTNTTRGVGASKQRRSHIGNDSSMSSTGRAVYTTDLGVLSSRAYSTPQCVSIIRDAEKAAREAHLQYLRAKRKNQGRYFEIISKMKEFD